MSISDELRTELLRAGEHPDQSLLDRVKALGSPVIPSLIEIAIDERLHLAEPEDPGSDKESPVVWAPIHAIRLLAEMGAVEAIEPLVPFFRWDDDDWLGQELPEAFGRIGEPALPAMEALLRDTEQSVWTRLRAARALTKIAVQVPALRDQVVATLTARLDPAEQQPDDDEVFTGFVICELLNLRAVEALPAIDAAFDADRVDQSIVDEDHLTVELDLASPLPEAQRRRRGLPGGLSRSEDAQPTTWKSPIATRVRAVGPVARNAPCPCGSGMKYKKCCGA